MQINLNHVDFPDMEIQANGFVRDQFGVIKISDPENMAQALKDALSVDELRKMDPEIVQRLGLAHKLEE